MHPFLTKLGIRPEVQEFFASYYTSDQSYNLIFPYGKQAETYGMAFHYIPATENYWLAGNTNLALVSEVFICGSAMEAIAWLHIHYHAYSQIDNLLFLSTGTKPCAEHFRWLTGKARKKDFSLLFGNDFIGKICDLKTAAALHNQPAAVSIANENVNITFRNKNYMFSQEAFSLNAIEKAAGYRFKVRTLKPKGFNTWQDLLKDQAFNQ